MSPRRTRDGRFAVKDNLPKSDAPREINNDLGLIFRSETSTSVDNSLGVTDHHAVGTCR
jgi:hypothetical protein